MSSKSKFTTVLLCLFSIISNLQSQTTSEILSYDYSTNSFENLTSSRYDATLKRDHTDHYIGAKSIVELDAEAPKSNLIAKTKFTNLIPVADIQKELTFPYTTGVKLVIPENGDKHQATGVMVGDRFVLSTAHSVLRKYTNEPLFNKIDVIASYDFALSEEELRTSVVKMYFVENWSIGDGEDLVLLELAEPIGESSGWMSIGFEATEQKLKGLYHKMSYPAYNTPYNDKPYTGDDLHYSYGLVDYVSEEFIGVQDHLIGLGGESGSPIFKTNNEDEFITYGVLTYLGNYNHSRIRPSIYFKFKEIITGVKSIIPVRSDELKKFDVYKIANNRVLVNWDVEDQGMFSYYEVERSVDGENFNYLTTVDSDEVTEHQGYTYLDEEPYLGKAYYRLIGVDTEQEMKVLDIKTLELESGSAFNVSVYPNPTTDFINVDANEDIDSVTTLSVYNSNGILIEETAFDSTNRLSTSLYEKGIYFLILNNETAKESFSFLVQ